METETQKDIRSMTIEELTQELERLGEKKYRAAQMFEWMHQKRAHGFTQMTNLPGTLREELSKRYEYTDLKVVQELTSEIDGTKKFLFVLADGNVVESVFMRYKHGNSVCISSQAGCRMGCKFCASTLGGLVRNLTPSEMLGQIYEIVNLTGEPVANVVVMGTGEPFDNYENLLRFIELLSDEKGMHISRRGITVSTCGIVPKMRDFADRQMPVTLALSLHAPTQEKREKLMPVAKRYEIREVLKACRYYFERTGRRITFEYALAGGENDSTRDAEHLAELIKDSMGGQNGLTEAACHVNLIPINPVRERGYVQPGQQAILAFKNKLEKNGINVTIRREMGRDINGACGQLRRSYITDRPERRSGD